MREVRYRRIKLSQYWSLCIRIGKNCNSFVGSNSSYLLLIIDSKALKRVISVLLLKVLSLVFKYVFLYLHRNKLKWMQFHSHPCAVLPLVYLSFPLAGGLWSMSVWIEIATPHCNATVFCGRSVNSTMSGRLWQSLAELPRAELSNGSQSTISVT